MGVIKGQNLRITIGGKYIAFATTCTVHVAAQLEESSTKDSTNGWQQQDVTGLSWDVSTDALYSVDADASGINGVDVLNINKLANCLKPVVLPGEEMTVKLVKQGKDPSQAIGYLDDGTMIVAEDGRRMIGSTTKITVTSVLQTSAGRMIFGRLKNA